MANELKIPKGKIRSGVAEITDVDLGRTGRKINVTADIGWAVKFVATIYTTNSSAFREQYINAISHGCLPIHAKGEETSVEIDIDFARRIVSITDVNGVGMPGETVLEIMSVLGKTGNDDVNRPGQHGVGFYSFLLFSSFAKLETWSRVTNEHSHWVCRQGQQFVELLDEPDTLQAHGTKITLSVKPDIDMIDLVGSIKDNVEMFPVKTFVTYRNTPESSTVQASFKDGTFEYGCKTYEEKLLEIGNEMITKWHTQETFSSVRKLETEFLDIYIGVTGQTIDNNQLTIYLCNVPIQAPNLHKSSNYYDSDSCFLGIPCIVHVKDESKFKPLDNRDNLDLRNTSDAQLFKEIITGAIGKYLRSIKINSILEIQDVEDSKLLINTKTHSYLTSNTRVYADLINNSVYDCMIDGHYKTVNLIELIQKRDKVLLMDKFNKQYTQVFTKDRDMILVRLKDLPYKLKANPLSEAFAPWKTINDIFMNATDYRKLHKIPLTVSDSEGKPRAACASYAYRQLWSEFQHTVRGDELTKDFIQIKLERPQSNTMKYCRFFYSPRRYEWAENNEKFIIANTMPQKALSRITSYETFMEDASKIVAKRGGEEPLEAKLENFNKAYVIQSDGAPILDDNAFTIKSSEFTKAAMYLYLKFGCNLPDIISTDKVLTKYCASNFDYKAGDSTISLSYEQIKCIEAVTKDQRYRRYITYLLDGLITRKPEDDIVIFKSMCKRVLKLIEQNDELEDGESISVFNDKLHDIMVKEFKVNTWKLDNMSVPLDEAERVFLNHGLVKGIHSKLINDLKELNGKNLKVSGNQVTLEIEELTDDAVQIIDGLFIGGKYEMHDGWKVTPYKGNLLLTMRFPHDIKGILND